VKELSVDDIPAIIFARVQDAAACQAIADNYPNGVGTFGPIAQRVNDVAGQPSASAKWLAPSGHMNPAMLEFFETSVNPLVQVVRLDGQTFDQVLATRTPSPLFRSVDVEEL
jgi:hypothetical protein